MQLGLTLTLVIWQPNHTMELGHAHRRCPRLRESWCLGDTHTTHPVRRGPGEKGSGALSSLTALQGLLFHAGYATKCAIPEIGPQRLLMGGLRGFTKKT